MTTKNRAATNTVRVHLYLALVVAIGSAVTQAAQLRDTGSEFGFAMMPESIGAPYQEGLDPSVLHWVYPGEPFVLQLTVWNNTTQPIEISRSRGDWFETVRLALFPDTKPKVNPSIPPLMQLTARTIRKQPIGAVTVTPATTTLGARGREEVRLQVNTAALKTIKPGVYVLRASLDERALPSVLRNSRSRVVAEVRVGLRQLETRTDYLNYYAHMATWARVNGNLDDARRWINELLLVNNTSTVAYTNLGHVERLAGNCAKAIESWQKAIDTLLVNGDPEEATFGKPVRNESIEALRQQIQRCR